MAGHGKGKVTKNNRGDFMATIDTISRQETIYRICAFCDGLMRRSGRPPSALAIRDSLTSMIHSLPSVSGATGSTGNGPTGRTGSTGYAQPRKADLDSLPLETRETADRIITTEAFLSGGTVGTEVYRCGVCRTQVYGKDRFCRGCGRELIKSDRRV